MRNNQKIIIFAESSVDDKTMFDHAEGLKALEELTENLRILFQREEQLKAEGWYSEEEFQKAVLDVFREFIIKLVI